MSKDIVIWDLDGTLADGRHRLHLLPTKDHSNTHSWDEFNLAAGGDSPIWDNIDLMQLTSSSITKNVILTGRSDVSRDITLAWLQQYGVPFDYLFMRPRDDHRRDVEFKEEALRSIGLDRILCCFDDLPHVAYHLRSLGLTCHLVTHYDEVRADIQSHGVTK